LLSVKVLYWTVKESAGISLNLGFLHANALAFAFSSFLVGFNIGQRRNDISLFLWEE